MSISRTDKLNPYKSVSVKELNCLNKLNEILHILNLNSFLNYALSFHFLNVGISSIQVHDVLSINIYVWWAVRIKIHV